MRYVREEDCCSRFNGAASVRTREQNESVTHEDSYVLASTGPRL